MLSPKTIEILKKLAKDKDIEEFIIEKVSKDLDPPERIELYINLYEKYLREAEDFYKKGDLVQAGEKLWGALTALLNAIAEKRGLPHYSHRDYAVIIDELYRETKDRDLVIGFGLAERLHANFYHNFISKDQFDLHREEVLKLIKKAKGFNLRKEVQIYL